MHMIAHSNLGSSDLRALIRAGKIRFGGNRRLKIYGTLQCSSGKKMKRENMVFFSSKKAAVASGYRPCGHCMRAAYKKWKESN